jgi:hypothetical protein
LIRREIDMNNAYIEEIDKLRAENSTLKSLLNGCSDIVELWSATTPIQIAWRQSWLKKVKEVVG